MADDQELNVQQSTTRFGDESSLYFTPSVGGNGPRRHAPKSWREQLKSELRQLNSAITHVIATTKNNNKFEATVKCTACNVDVSELQIVRLQCQDRNEMKDGGDMAAYEEPKHYFCKDCVAEMIRHQSVTRRPLFQQSDKSHRYETLRQELNVRMRLRPGESKLQAKVPFLLLCPKCRSPNVVVRENRFQCGLDRGVRARSLNEEFVVNLDATRLLADHFVVEVAWENQRRPPFGVFSRENLLVVDFHGKYCLPDGSALDDVDTLDALNNSDEIPLPNSKWLWMEHWASAPGPAKDGWIYMFNFHYPVPNGGRQYEPSMLTFVRQRKLIRTRIRFTEDVIEQLNKMFSDKSSEDANDDEELSRAEHNQ
jgi:hypothetical protein